MNTSDTASIEIAPKVLYFGTPVALISTVDAAGRPNLSPISSVWSLGDRLVLGIGTAGQGWQNLSTRKEAVINLPGPLQCAQIESMAPTTGRAPVPLDKLAMGYRFEADKFALAGLSATASVCVRPPRVAECPLQIEAVSVAAHAAAADEGTEGPAFMIVELQVLVVHAHRYIVVPGTNHIDTARWSPLLYVFRHYFSAGERLRRNFRAET